MPLAVFSKEREALLVELRSHDLSFLLQSIEGSDWRAELLRAIGYVFSKEREALLAELRSHVLSHPNASLDEVQKLEQKIRNQVGFRKHPLPFFIGKRW